MIHIKETEIIPLLKEAQTEYSQKITEGDPKDVEMAERIEEALTQAMDIVYDYQSITDEHKRMVEKYETEAPVIKTGQATVGVAIPIADKATRYKGGGSTRNNDGSANGLGIGEPGAPANTLTAADRHGVACGVHHPQAHTIGMLQTARFPR